MKSHVFCNTDILGYIKKTAIYSMFLKIPKKIYMKENKKIRESFGEIVIVRLIK